MIDPRHHLIFQRVTVLAAVALGVGLVVSAVARPQVAPLAYYLAIPLIAILCRVPTRIGRAGGVFEIGFEFCVLIFLACVIPEPALALGMWSVGVGLGQLANGKLHSTKAFNVALGMIGGAAAVLVIETVGGDTVGGLRELFGVALGAAVYFTVDYALSGVSIALEERTSVVSHLREPDTATAFAVFLAMASLGYLAAVEVRLLGANSWAAALVVVPVLTLLAAVRAQSRGREQSRRLETLLATSREVYQLDSEPAVLDALLSGARGLVRDPRMRLQPTYPGVDDLAIRIRGARAETWLTGPVAQRAGATRGDDERGLLGLVSVAEEALDRLALSADMVQLAWYDPLTGLANRTLFRDRLGHAADVQARRGGMLAVLFCDLDGFKRVNDVLGHSAGDELLGEVGRRIRSSVRDADTVARLGGDEFAVLLENVSHPSEVARACERILAALRERIRLGGETVSVTITIGVAFATPDASADALLTHADLAMYEAKALGKNRYLTYEPTMGDDRLRRLELVESLRAAIEHKDLTLHYQPVVDLRTGAVYGIEALARWRRNGVLVPPDLFIPAAEEAGLIVALGDLVLEKFTAEVPAMRAAAGRRLAVGCNVSPQQLQLRAFADQVLAARAAMGDVDLVLEVTERDFVNNDPQTLAAMNELAAADVRFAVDDFGVGFSSIGYLHQLPVRILKIDKSFLATIEQDERGCALVRSIKVMGEALGLDVVAEGVERAGQVEHLTQHAGVTIGQGYLFGRPMPLAGMLELLRTDGAVVGWESGADRAADPFGLGHAPVLHLASGHAPMVEPVGATVGRRSA